MFYNNIKTFVRDDSMDILNTVNSQKYRQDRVILHSDCNGFYASVECLHNPSIRNKPVAVSGDAENRHGIILAKNEIAKKYNIKTGEPIWQAMQKCPELVTVPAHFELYKRFSKSYFVQFQSGETNPLKVLSQSSEMMEGNLIRYSLQG